MFYRKQPEPQLEVFAYLKICSAPKKIQPETTSSLENRQSSNAGNHQDVKQPPRNLAGVNPMPCVTPAWFCHRV
jgi:hypothetical protein